MDIAIFASDLYDNNLLLVLFRDFLMNRNFTVTIERIIDSRYIVKMICISYTLIFTKL